MFNLHWVQIIHEDCLIAMSEIPDKSIDMILTDLPYGTTARNKWDCIIPFKELWEQYERVIKDNGAIVLFSQQPFTSELIQSNKKLFRYEWIWEKSMATGFLNAKKMPMKCHENILVFYKKLPTYNPIFTEGKPYTAKAGRHSSNYGEQVQVTTVNDGKRHPRDVIRFKNETGLHPTQKPVELCEYLIKTYSNEGETVLDSCMGSGTTGIAAMNTNRKFIGIEKESEYFEMAKSRIIEHSNKSVKK